MENFTEETYIVKESCSIAFDALKCMPTIVNAEGEKANILDIVGYLFTASAYFLSRLSHSRFDPKISEEALAFYLSYIKLNVEVDEDRQHVRLIEAKEDPVFEIFKRLNHGSCSPRKGQPTEPIVVKVNEGSIIFQIQNLNIYNTADVVQQLNVNPQEVINNNYDKIKEAVIEVVKQMLVNGIDK